MRRLEETEKELEKAKVIIRHLLALLPDVLTYTAGSLLWKEEERIAEARKEAERWLSQDSKK